MQSRKLFLQSKVNSLFNSVTYRLGSTVIDPGDKQDWRGIEHVLLTHSHFDHIYGLNSLWEENHLTKIYTNQYGYRALLDPKINLSKYYGEPFTFNHPDNIVIVNDKDIINIGYGLTAQAIFTPGHNDSCITWMVGDLLFTGDSYIPGMKVVTNLPGVDRVKASESINLITELAIGSTIYPGHKID